jgi:16S rRNA (uracil1498-N3)-methyltransferase
VLRVEPGQQFEISDGRGVYLAEVAQVAKAHVRFRVLEALDAGGALPSITAVVSLIKFDRFEWIVEKLTELGVTRIVPVEAARSESGLLAAAAKRVERWRKIARESSQQSRRLAPPEIAEPCKLSVAVNAIAGLRYRLEERARAPLLIAAPFQPAECALLVGPEGGWQDGERERLDAAGWTGVSLGPTILRAETAAIAAVSVLAQLWFAATPD